MKYIDPIQQKIELIKLFEKKIDTGRVKIIKQDPHTKRLPRPCGITIHLGAHCPFSCSYCYIDSLGFKFKETEPYSLSPEETILALLYNSSFIPGKLGTFIALGSIVDPFYPKIRQKTVQLIELIDEYLYNPIQFSTKMFISEDIANQLKDIIKNSSLSPLITLVTIQMHDKLEPNAPKPELRYRTISNLRRVKFKPFLFIRPIIPGVTDVEIHSILEHTREYEVEGIVVGSLRVTKNIMQRLKDSGINMRPILSRISGKFSDRQMNIYSSDLKRKIIEKAKEMNILAYNSACCANAYAANVPCFGQCFYTKFCVRCPNDCPKKIPKFDPDYLTFLLVQLFNIRPIRVALDKNLINVDLPKFPRKKNIRHIKVAIQTVFRRRVNLRIVQ